METSVWYALLPEREVRCPEEEFFAQVGQGHTDDVVDEAFTRLRLRRGMAPVRRIAVQITRGPTVRRVRITEGAFEATLGLMLARADKRWSFTDCSSFVTMKETEILRVFTIDHKFTEAGVKVLPRSIVGQRTLNPARPPVPEKETTPLGDGRGEATHGD